MLRDDQEIKQVLIALAQLARLSRQPLVLCIDQVENLDPDKLKPLCRFLHAVLDHTANLLVITSGVKQTLLEYREDDIIPEAAWDRIAQYKVELNRVHKGEARKILEARLERFHDRFLELNAVRQHVHTDTLFPLGQNWLERRFEDVLEVRPRDVLTWARDAWEEEQSRLDRLGGETWVHSWPDFPPSVGKNRGSSAPRRNSKRRSTKQSTPRSKKKSPSTACNLAACHQTRVTWPGWSRHCSGNVLGKACLTRFAVLNGGGRKPASCRRMTCWSVNSMTAMAGKSRRASCS